MNKIKTNELISKGFEVKNGKWYYKGNPCIIDFYADWCKPCKTQDTILSELKKYHNDVEFYKVNVEEEYELAELFSIKSLPTIIVCGKDETKTFTGFTTKQKIDDAINKVL
ncbi:MAG: thioredoxin family protein [Ignavibacteria bacterium]|nr:thioredoxin family protein [Ignavibacteria bacterium]